MAADLPIPTVTIALEDGSPMIINRADFDPALHVPYDKATAEDMGLPWEEATETDSEKTETDATKTGKKGK
jgi:hypothetical protein